MSDEMPASLGDAAAIANLQVLTDLKKAADNADGVAVETANVLKVLARLYGWNGTGFSRLRIEDGSVDTLATSRDAIISHAEQRYYNDATGVWERARNNREVQLLAPLQRAAGTNSATLIAYNAKSALLTLSITARTVGAAPSLTVNIMEYDPGAAGFSYLTYVTFDPVIGLHTFNIGTGIANLATGSPNSTARYTWARTMPRRMYLQFIYAADITDLTYSLGAVLS